ncbi:hypothetical protein MTR_4g113780 [Medicago truncatula]|uniref:Uncharacterized protein n=1 Tax=Medicago truncatula TaxID=3880 RepID=G7JVA2_MEDTR|nr:hypothetical protein MTR_4g113780 [Medicago truncatula]
MAEFTMLHAAYAFCFVIREKNILHDRKERLLDLKLSVSGEDNRHNFSSSSSTKEG